MANVYFYLNYADHDPLDNNRLSLQPYYYPIGSGSAIEVGDPVSQTLDSSGYTIFNDLFPNLYLCRAYGDNLETTWYILVPTGSATYNAVDLIWPPNEYNLTWIPEYAISASWASSSVSASLAQLARTASYIQGSNVHGYVPSASFAFGLVFGSARRIEITDGEIAGWEHIYYTDYLTGNPTTCSKLDTDYNDSVITRLTS